MATTVVPAGDKTLESVVPSLPGTHFLPDADSLPDAGARAMKKASKKASRQKASPGPVVQVSPNGTVSGLAVVRSRRRLKADRRAALLQAAAVLFADRGFRAVRLEDLGAAVGVSGPAVYRHFPNKEAVLVELLVGISERLLAGGLEAHAEQSDAAAELRALIGFHVDFALRDRELIRIQDRDFTELPDGAKHRVRTLQRRYVEFWVDAQRRNAPALDAATARLKAHAAFGLINSTPYSITPAGESAVSRSREILVAMTAAALST